MSPGQCDSRVTRSTVRSQYLDMVTRRSSTEPFPVNHFDKAQSFQALRAPDHLSNGATGTASNVRHCRLRAVPSRVSRYRTSQTEISAQLNSARAKSMNVLSSAKRSPAYPLGIPFGLLRAAPLRPCWSVAGLGSKGGCSSPTARMRGCLFMLAALSWPLGFEGWPFNVTVVADDIAFRQGAS
jgi:hypothetical protein